MSENKRSPSLVLAVRDFAAAAERRNSMGGTSKRFFLEQAACQFSTSSMTDLHCLSGVISFVLKFISQGASPKLLKSLCLVAAVGVWGGFGCGAAELHSSRNH